MPRLSSDPNAHNTKEMEATGWGGDVEVKPLSNLPAHHSGGNESSTHFLYKLKGWFSFPALLVNFRE